MQTVERNRYITGFIAALIALLIGAIIPFAHAVHAAPITATTPNGIWISAAELPQLPMSGPAWQQFKAAADGSLGAPNIADQDSNHDVKTLAVALVYTCTGTVSYRAKAANAIIAAIGTEAGVPWRWVATWTAT